MSFEGLSGNMERLNKTTDAQRKQAAAAVSPDYAAWIGLMEKKVAELAATNRAKLAEVTNRPISFGPHHEESE